MSGNLIPLAKITIEKGLQTGPFGSQLKANEYTKSGIPIVMPKDICNGKITTQSIAYTTKEKSQKIKNHLIKSGDILFPRRGDLGRIAVAEDTNEGWICGTGCLRARLRKDVLPSFIHQYVQLERVVKWLESNALGQTMLNLNTEIIGALPIYLPPYEEQKAIAEILQTWDTAIEKTKALIDAKERQFGWLITRLINEQKEHLTKLGEHFGKSIYIEKGKPLIKANIADNGYIPVIAGGKTSPYSHGQYTHSMPCITVSASGAYAGYVWYHDYPIWASDCNVIYSKEHSTEYLQFALKSKQSKIYAFQSGGGQPHVYARDLKNIAIPLPSLPEQKRIAHTLNTARREIDLLKQLAEKYKTQKRGLMQKMLTGEWRVKPETVNQYMEA